jgi:hypothetical protein
MHRIRTLVVNHLWWLVLVVAVAMLVAHSFGMQRIIVDNTSLVLLVLVLLSPFVAAIKKIKIGEFEAEIEPEEVKRVAQQAEHSLPEPSPDATLSPEVGATAAAIKALSETDPVIALAKLRIELESRLRRLHHRVDPDTHSQKRPVALTHIIRNLVATEEFGSDLGAALRDVIAICNRAIHGEDIRDVDARQIVDTGIDLLEALERNVREYATTHPVETSVIARAELDDFQNGRYRLTTIVPLVDKPQRRVYVLTQDELDSFFDLYPEFAEFVVALEKIA